MLYKKSTEKSLSKELFKNPTSEYRGSPFWSWNCELKKDELLRQIEVLKEMGFGGFHMHSRSGMATPYLSDEFMELVTACCDKAEQEDMLAYLYDEDRWPSGAAGGIVTKDKKYGQRHILITVTPMDSTTDFDDAYNNGTPYYVCEYNVSLNKNGELISYTASKASPNPNETKWYAYVLLEKPSGWYNNQTYVNTLSKEAIDKFIKTTHEAYKKAVGDRFGKVIPSIFTDEPQFSEKGTLDFASSKKDISLPWAMDFDDGFKEKYGYSILEKLPELFWELSDNQQSLARYHYHDYVTYRFTTSFADNCGIWCENNGIALTGHMLREESLHSQTSSIGEAMRAYRHFEIPGIDMLCDAREYTTAKQAQSAAHQFGREGVMSELYGVTNWDFDFRGHKSQGDWQAALGITLRVPHLSWVSMKGDAKRDYPASINYQSSWYKEYSYVENHFARVNTALTRGKPVVKVAVIHPVETYWLHYGPKENTSDIRTILDEQFHSIAEWLLSGLIDFDYICESLLPDQIGNITDTLTVGEMSYNSVIVAGCETLRSSTVEILKKFRNAGGNIIFAQECPKYMDAAVSDEPKKLYDSCTNIQLNKTNLLNAVSNERIIDIKESDGQRSSNMLYQMREDNDCKWLFIAYMKKENESDNSAMMHKRKIIINGEYTPLHYDTLTGDIKEIEFEIIDGKTCVYYTFYKYDSLLLQLNKPTKTECHLPVSSKEIISEEYLTDKVGYTLSEPNVLLLDIAEYHPDNEPFRAREETRKIQNICKKQFNLVNNYAQPWVIEPEIPEHSVTLRYRFYSELEVQNALLATEDADVCKILFNGESIANNITGYFTDKSIETIPLPCIRKGENIIEITYPLGNRTTVENIFVLGDFNVRCEGITKTLIPPSRKIGFGDIVPQGLPFYGANITYTTEIEAPEECYVSINVPVYKGTVMKAEIDDTSIGTIAYPPYSSECVKISKGVHTLRITLFASRHNCFGPLHLIDTDNTFGYYWYGPSAWEFMGDPGYWSHAWAYEYHLKQVGILAAPKITYFK